MLRVRLLGCSLLASLSAGCEGAASDGDDADQGETLVCTELECTSSFTLTISHDLALADGGHVLQVDTPLQEIRCSLPAAASGMDSCFGFRFADVSWDAQLISLKLTEPFFDTDLNPEALPFESVQVRIDAGGATVVDEMVQVDGGTPLEPNGAGCPPLCYEATAQLDISN